MTAPSVLYVGSASISDPLIVSQVIRYLERMRHALSSCHLITFERDDSLNASQISKGLLESGIHWHPIRSSKRLRAAGIWIDRQRALKCARKLIDREGINIVHCRSFLAGNLGRKLKSDRVKFLYDMRGLWALEKRDKGTIRNAQIFRVAQHLERKLFRDADCIVSLTHVGKQYLREAGVSVPIAVIPTCVDLDRFQPRSDSTIGELRSVVSAGTLGAGYLAPAMCRFGAMMKSKWPDVAFRFLTASDHRYVINQAVIAGLPETSVDVLQVSPEAIPGELASANVGLCFMKPSEARVASCPTKLAEYFACGVPVVATDGLGDVTEIVERNRVGLIIRHNDESSWGDTIQNLDRLLHDPGLKSRCRRVAETLFGVNDGAASYLSIYEQLLDGTSVVHREAA
jgi:glycosyltransferase involved in cell wall biosynthesis